jgi:hypothetical protein
MVAPSMYVRNQISPSTGLGQENHRAFGPKTQMYNSLETNILLTAAQPMSQDGERESGIRRFHVAS